MDAIKKKMLALREETDRAVAKANAAEAAFEAASERADEMEEKQRKFQKKLSEKENQFEVMSEDLVMAEIKAEEKEKLFQTAEQDIAQLERTIILKEAEVTQCSSGSCYTFCIHNFKVERSEENLGNNTTSMYITSKQADGADKVRKELERAMNQ